MAFIPEPMQGFMLVQLAQSRYCDTTMPGNFPAQARYKGQSTQ